MFRGGATIAVATLSTPFAARPPDVIIAWRVRRPDAIIEASLKHGSQ
jgi:hypothetical protein